jgi:hypothetical protein
MTGISMLTHNRSVMNAVHGMPCVTARRNNMVSCINTVCSIDLTLLTFKAFTRTDCDELFSDDQPCENGVVI